MKLFVLASLVFISCKPQYKKCSCESNDEVQKAYSEIVNEIIEHQTYNYYLGDDEERIFKAYVESHGDSSKIHDIDREVIRLQNKIYNDSARFCTVFLDTTTNGRFSTRINIGRINTETLQIITAISNNPDSTCTLLSTIQTKYLPKDFALI